jgi:hypothetical protein
MISLTRREFDLASSTLTAAWIEATWASLARRPQPAPRPESLPAAPREPRNQPAMH